MKEMFRKRRLWIASLASAAFMLVGAQAQSLKDGLEAAWLFEGDHTDSWGEFDGEPQGSEDHLFIEGPGDGFGSALLLNGEDQFVLIPGSEEALGGVDNSLTISAWFRVDAFDTNWQALIAKGEGGRWRLHRRGGGNVLAWTGGNGGDTPDEGPAVNDGEWHHVAAVTDANSGKRLYIDGQLAATHPDENATIEQNTMPVMIGENPDARNREWEGGIDEVGIWTRALSEAEIIQLSQQSLGDALGLNEWSGNDGLVAHWRFDGNYDDSVGGFNGEPRGDVSFTDGPDGFGQAILLNGEDQHVEITGGNENDLEFPGGDMSISGWFRVDNFDTNWQALISKGEGSNYRVARRGGSGKIAYAGGIGEPGEAAPDVNDGEWHHFVAISDSSKSTQLWIDGVLAEETDSAPTLGESDLPLLIGENPGARNREWEGAIDDIAIWNRVLTADEIADLSTTSIDLIINPPQDIRAGRFTSRANGFSWILVDTDEASLQDDSVKFTLDGSEIDAASLSFENDGENTIFTYTADDFLPSESLHLLVVDYTTNNGDSLSREREFQTPTYGVVDASLAAEGVDTSAGGFRIRAYSTEPNIQNRLFFVEQVLRGEHGDNQANLGNGPDLDRDGQPDLLFPEATDGFIDGTVINYDRFGADVGDFKDPDFIHPILTDGTIPGSPGFQTRDSGTGNAVLEINTYIEFPETAVYTLGVTSDDGFKVSIAGSNRDALGNVLGFFDGGRGASPTEFQFLISEPGIYPVRLLWFNGGGGSNIEFWSKLADGTKVLINDPDTDGALKAYYAKSGGEPARVTIADGLNQLLAGGSVRPDISFSVEIEDGTSRVVDESVSLTVNGEAASVSRSGGTVTASYTPAELLPALAPLDIVFTWSDSDGRTSSSSLSATVLDYPLVASYVTPIGSGGSPGMNWRVHQQEGARANNTGAGEGQLALAPNGPENLADLSLADDPDNATFYVDWINFEQAGGTAGNFQSGATDLNLQVQDGFIPGIPGSASAETDNIAGEVTTFVEFPDAGLYEMGVNSDDGFRVTIATSEGDNSLTDPEALQLGVFSGGRGASDTLFSFVIAEPGVYPMRVIWYEGTGGANIEWFTVDANGGRALVNGEQPGALRAYRTRSGAPGPFVPQPDPPVAVEISVSIINNGDGTVTITWEGGNLESSDTVDGGYTAVAGSSPLTVDASGAATFYRVQ